MFSTMLLGQFSPVNPKEFEELKELEVAELESSQALIRVEIEEMEAWLGAPPSDATATVVWEKVGEWDEARQWYFAHTEAIAWRQTPEGRRAARMKEIKMDLRQLKRAAELLDEYENDYAYLESIEDQINTLEKELDILSYASTALAH